MRTISRYTAAEAARWFFPGERDSESRQRLGDNIRRLWQGEVCEVLKCADCRFAFPMPYVGADGRLYKEVTIRQWYPTHRWEFEEAAEFIGVTAGARPSILEIGAGTGAFITRLRSDARFASATISATEHSRSAISRLSELGVDVLEADVRALARDRYLQGSWDYICIFNTVTYMAEVAQVFRLLRCLLRPGGYLCISVATGERIDFNQRYLGFHDMPPIRAGRWYRETFEALAVKCDLLMVRYELEPQRIVSTLAAISRVNLEAASARSPRGIAGKVCQLNVRWGRVALKAAVGVVFALRLPLIVREFPPAQSQFVVLRKAR